MREIIIISILSADLLFIVICITCFFVLYGEKIKRYNRIRSRYVCPINVRCTLLDNKEMNQNYANWAEGYGGNTRVAYNVVRPSFHGIINGKTYTFVRRRDIHQPVCEVGKNYTIFLQNLDEINCGDFYEANEVVEMNALIRRKKKEYSVLIGLSLAVSAASLAILL